MLEIMPIENVSTRLAFGGGEGACLDRSSKLKKIFKNNNPEVLNTR